MNGPKRIGNIKLAESGVLSKAVHIIAFDKLAWAMIRAFHPVFHRRIGCRDFNGGGVI